VAEYQINDYYRAIAEAVIDKKPELQHIKENGVRIAYITSDAAKTKNGKVVGADCEKVKYKFKTFMPYDFIITVYEPNVTDFSENQLKILMWHELLHVGSEATAAGVRFSIIPHDFEDFNIIVSEFGNWWASPGAEPWDILAAD